MSEILSQSEIDALLSALTSGEVTAEEMREADDVVRLRTYDFRRAMRFSKDHIRIISRIHEYFARLMTTHLSGQLRTVVQLQVESVDQVPYEEFIRSIPTLTVIHVMEFLPLEGKVVVEMNPQIVFAMLDRSMGGVTKGPYKERELTEIETALLNHVMGQMTNFFAEAWRNVAELRPRLISMESNPQFVQLTTPNETVLVVTLGARIGAASGLLNVCIPHITVEPLLPKLSTQFFMDVNRSRARPDHEIRTMQSFVHQMEVELSVRLGQAELDLGDLLDLQPGDVIPLHSPVASPVQVLVDQVPTFLASVGRVRDHYAVQIVAEIEEVNADGRESETFSGGDRRVAE